MFLSTAFVILSYEELRDDYDDYELESLNSVSVKHGFSLHRRCFSHIPA
jgi:hypothetical protein